MPIRSSAPLGRGRLAPGWSDFAIRSTPAVGREQRAHPRAESGRIAALDVNFTGSPEAAHDALAGSETGNPARAGLLDRVTDRFRPGDQVAVVDDHFLAGEHVELVDGAVAFGKQHAPAAGFEHEESPPEVVGPEGLKSWLSWAREMEDRIPESQRPKLLCERPIEIRVVNPVNPFAPKKVPPVRYAWFRAIHPMPDDPVIHRYMLAYASDFGFVSASLYPHGHTYWEPKMQVTSLDHAMWFHRDFRMDDWLLYVTQSPSASGARGMNFGKIYQHGKLVASTAQEGLIRYHGDLEKA